jgi:hypothetical protein
LHTTWGWTQGLLQYVDFFDNHTPLFHISFSPLVAALGERTDILTWMRFAIVPLWFVCLWCVWKIGCAVFSRRAGLWSAVCLSLLPWWFFPALEYRTDNLWVPLWLGALTVLVTGRMSVLRAFAGGVLLGLCFCTSMKTSVLFAVCAMAALGAVAVSGWRFGFGEMARLLRWAAPVLGGAVIAPAILCGYFYTHGAWREFYYGVIEHNILPGVDARNHPKWLRLVFPVAVPFLAYAALKIARKGGEPRVIVRRVFLFLVAGLYYAALYSFWTLLTRQDFLTFYPVLVVVAVPFALWLVERAGGATRWPLILSALGVIEIALILGGRPPWIDGTTRERQILGEVLRLTKPGEYVMDFKGECVFRRRAFFYVTEPLTYVRLKRGIIPDTVAADLVGKGVHVVLNQDRWYPKQASEFMTANYLPVGRLRVAGRMIASEPVASGSRVEFELMIPGSYVLWADGAPVSGNLDGAPYIGPRELAAGRHVFLAGEAHPRVAVIWARAVEAGFTRVGDPRVWEPEKWQ